MIVLAGAFGALNYFFLKLPSAIGILVVSLLASLVIVLVDLAVPALGIADVVRATVTGIDFSKCFLKECWASCCLRVLCMSNSAI